MPKTKPTVKRRPGNPRALTYPRSCYFRPHVVDAEVLDRYCAVTRQAAGVVLRQMLSDWARRTTVRTIAAGTVDGKGGTNET